MAEPAADRAPAASPAGAPPILSLACQWGACDGCPDDECTCTCHPGEPGGATSAWEHHHG